MNNLVYEIKENEILTGDYFKIDYIKKLTIPEEWLSNDGALGVWAKSQVGNKKWKMEKRETGEITFIYLSK